jgi:hydroxymethylpyrimidine/phosphomethylpyrimidine kinase
LREAESLRICEEISRVVGELEAAPGVEALVPQVGINIAMAPLTARTVDDVIGLSGRIVRVGGRARACGCPSRGGSAHMARMALALRQLTGNLGCCMNIRYSESILDACSKLNLSAAKVERELEPEGEKTMSWAIKNALGRLPQPPDLVYDLGSVGKEPMIRILGSTPGEVAGKAARIAGALR